MDFDYKKYSLEKLEEWMHDVMSASEATPQEIYDVIKVLLRKTTTHINIRHHRHMNFLPY